MYIDSSQTLTPREVTADADELPGYTGHFWPVSSLKNLQLYFPFAGLGVDSWRTSGFPSKRKYAHECQSSIGTLASLTS